MKILILLCFLSIVSWSKQEKKNIIFDLADLTVDYEIDDESVFLEAFKTSINDKIIQSEDTEKYSRLTWVSVGIPRLVYINQSHIFIFNNEGFSINIELLTDTIRNLFVQVAKRKYSIQVDLKQIIFLKPDRFECGLRFYDKNGDKYLLNGKASHLSKFPIDVFFEAPAGSMERVALEEILHAEFSIDKTSNIYEEMGISLQCEISAQGRGYQQNSLILSAKQINQLHLVEEVFGPKDSVYVTRKQMSSLAHSLYQQLDIIEEYRLPEREFSSKFVQDLIAQTAELIDQYEPIEKVLENLSPYELKEDIQPDVITEELSRVFTIDKINSQEKLVLNKAKLEKNGDSSAFGLKVNMFANIKALPRVNFNAGYADSDGTISGFSSVSDALNALNSNLENEIQWSRKGNTIIPKSIKASKLARANFMKTLRFSRIKKYLYDAPFKRVYFLKRVHVQEKNNQLTQLNSEMLECKAKLDKLMENEDFFLSLDLLKIERGFLNGSSTVNFEQKFLKSPAIHFSSKYFERNSYEIEINFKTKNGFLYKYEFYHQTKNFEWNALGYCQFDIRKIYEILDSC
ncbi:hypothetical protein BpHYR1_040013 [Brachionus plicatilis]|uniref:Uncharacterized protein n=1 Tax=Brachionus plicatilis TaxID=10195 RepID=A0A3M7QZ98_BRAPC|nr:hypothetical protein BpHYR1_040013 [Brachionus plicatilis]